MNIHPPLKLPLFVIVSVVCLIFGSCASVVKCTFYCDNSALDIYVDGQKLGQGLVNYVAPKGTENVKVSVMNDSKMVYERIYYIKDFHHNELIQINIPNNYYYSTSPKIHN